MDFVPHTDADVAVMLAALGLPDLDALFTSIPAGLRYAGELDVPGPLAELEVRRLLQDYAARNRADLVCFAGGGAYDHDLPSPVRALVRPEFATSYTPYQPEVAQGVLQGLFEYQSMLCTLTGMQVANASLYDGASALVESLTLAVAATGRTEVWMSRGVNPRFREVARTHAAGSGIVIREIDDWPAEGSPAALVVAQPSYLGPLSDVAAVSARAHELGALCITVLEPLAAGLVKRPGDGGADVVVGEGQLFGNALNFGGPYVGLFATTLAHVRQVPGRIVGSTVDLDGRPCYVLTLQAREQHIRREKASSNVCTNQTLNALAAAIHLSWLGPDGLREFALQCARKARYAAEKLAAVPGCALLFPDRPYLREFALRVPQPSDEVLADLLDEGFLGGIDLQPDYPELGSAILVALTEKRTREEIDGLADALAKAVGAVVGAGGQATGLPLLGGDPEPTLQELSQPGRRAWSLPALDVPAVPLDDIVPEWARADAPPPLPEVAERDMVAHWSRLAHRNYAVDLGAYPLGSCTMKYNPKVADDVAGLPAFTGLHPAAPEAAAQGTLAVMAALEQALCSITGMAAATLQPAAGAAGELTGLLIMRAYHSAQGDVRQRVLIPDGAHGTNPASVRLAGYDVVAVPSTAEGLVDVAALRAVTGPDVAGLMLTNPNTVGLFERDIEEIARAMHEVGALLYYDGANLNAILGMARPGDMGFDIVHSNLHKTFATPHGGGGPGAGPVAVGPRLVEFLPGPKPEWDAEAGRFRMVVPARSIGRIHSHHGNVGILIRAFAYMVALGPPGLRRVAQAAVLNARYLQALVAERYPSAYPGDCMHEFVATAGPLKKAAGVRAMDVAKALLDRGFHAPTVYFPLIVDEALMCEPTETESRDTVEALAAALLEIADVADRDPEALHRAPERTPVRRPDEALAARKLRATWLTPPPPA